MEIGQKEKKEGETWTLLNTAYKKERKKEQTFLVK